MGLINKKHTFSDNTNANPLEVNENFDDIYNEFNGNIEDANHSAITVDDEDSTWGLVDKPGKLFNRIFTKVKDVLGTSDWSIPISLSSLKTWKESVDTDGDGTVDNSLNVTSTYKSNDIDTNGDGVVDKSDDTLAYKGNDIDTNGDGKVNSAEVADSLASGFSDIAILTGTISDGQTLPLPSGYTENQCKWIVSINHVNSDKGSTGSHIEDIDCYVDANRVVRVNWHTAYGTYPGTANYMVIGIK